MYAWTQTNSSAKILVLVLDEATDQVASFQTVHHPIEFLTTIFPLILTNYGQYFSFFCAASEQEVAAATGKIGFSVISASEAFATRGRL